MHKRNKYYAAGFALLIGIAAALGSLDYHMGTLARMGPGYFPLLLGITLALIGVLIAITPDAADAPPTDAQRASFKTFVRQRLRPWIATAGGVIAFIVLGKYGGLAPATFALIFIAALGDPKNSVKACFWLAVGVVTFAVVAFHYGLRLQFPLFSWG